MLKRVLIPVFWFLCINFANAQSNITVDIQNESTLTLVGSTNIASFQLIQKGNKLAVKKYNIEVTLNKGQVSFGQNKLSLAVTNFSSDNPIAYHDFMQLLKVKVYPELFVQLESMTIQSINKADNSVNGNAFVAITITGVKKEYMIPFTSSRNGDLISVDGKHKLSIRDFALVPPTKLMGLVRTSEMVDIKFHFIFKMNNKDII